MRFRFRSLRTRLSVLYAGLFASALLAVALVAQVIVEQNARAAVRAELGASAAVYDRLWTLRERALADAAGVLARDFGFRSAVASHDRATIESALVSLRQRAHVTDAMVVDLDGEVVGARGALARAVATLPFAGDTARHGSVMVVDGVTWRTTVTPILAPTEIGWVVFAVRLDAAEMRALERLSSIPLTATVLHRTPAGHWRSDDGAVPVDRATDALVAASSQGRVVARLSLPSGDALATARPLLDAEGKPTAALMIRYPLDLAYAPWRPLQIGIALAGLAALLVVLLGSRRLARDITRPIAALDAAAQSLEEGSRAEVAVEGEDEIGRLAQSFNRMSAGIVERENRITHLAFHDSLTGLPNRVSLRQALAGAIDRGQRSHAPVAVLCLDMDGFKGVNDTLGHPVGDALLAQFGRLLSRLAPEGFVARLGGDEFAIILADGFDPDRPRALAQAILDAVADPIEAAGHRIATGTSVGIAMFPSDGGDAEQLIKNADLALYRAKQDGRSVFRFFEPALDEAARKRRELELDLRNALKTGQFALAFQPIVDMKTGRVGCFESLLRWHHPVRGTVSPAEFVPVAEDCGLIVSIGEWVMHEACRVAAGWPSDVRVAVNVSPLQFRNTGFQTIVLQALARSGLPPRRLEVEITESVFLDGEDHVVKVLHGLRELGVRVALDDFGTGYSSLSYLRSFPFDKIKIDRSFVTSIAADRSAAAIVRAIVDLATALDMETTAEGVEDDEQLSRLRGQGCSSIQGFLFSRPLDAAGARDYICGQAARAA